MRIVVKGSTFEVPLKNITLLTALVYIEENIDPTLKFKYNCKSGVCGRCPVRVNNQETLSCEYKAQDGDKVEALLHKSSVQNRLKRVESWLHVESFKPMGEASESKIERQSDCLLCSSCFSACPVLHVKPDFLGPYALTRAYRYVADIREEDKKGFIERVQEGGIWDCTLCAECTLACPVGIDPKADVLHLRTKSMQLGYFDPTPQCAFEDDFGFNPNF